MLDIIGSMVIRGAIVLMTLYLSVGLQNAYTYKRALYTVKQKTVVPAEILTDDLRLAGFGPPGTSKQFIQAQPDTIEFWAQLNSVDSLQGPRPFGDTSGLPYAVGPAVHSTDATVNDVCYYLAPAPVGSAHRILYRQIDHGTLFELARDVDSLCFTYYDSVGVQKPYGNGVSGIKSIKVSLVMESNAQVADEITTAPSAPGLYSRATAVDTTTNFPTKYVRAFWERTVFPQNL